MLKRAAALVLGLAIVVLGQTPASAAAPGNDTEARAVAIGEVPFSTTVDTSDAVADEPVFCGNRASVFYTLTTAAGEKLQIDTLGSDYDTTIGVYTRDGSAIQTVECNKSRLGWNAAVRFRAQPGTTYVVIVTDCCGRSSPDQPNATRGGGSLTLSVTRPVADALSFDVATPSQGTVDASSGIATVDVTVTCNKRSVVYFVGTLRQIRSGMFVARGYVWGYVSCTPDGAATSTSEIDTDTSVAFGSGVAKLRLTYQSGWAGWGDGYDDYDEVTTDITLT
jgi:hypothetical protein